MPSKTKAVKTRQSGIAVRIPTDLHARFKAFCARLNRTQADVIRDMIGKELDGDGWEAKQATLVNVRHLLPQYHLFEIALKTALRHGKVIEAASVIRSWVSCSIDAALYTAEVLMKERT